MPSRFGRGETLAVLFALALCATAPVSSAPLVGPAEPQQRAGPDDPPRHGPDRDCDPGNATDSTRGTGSGASGPAITSLLANPLTRGDDGEFVVVAVPDGANVSGWRLADGHVEAALPDRSLSGRIALATEPDVARDRTDYPVVALEGRLRLADDGDRLTLYDGREAIDAIRYERAPTAALWYRTAGADDSETDDGVDAPATGRWRPRGATCFRPSNASVDEATAFVLPDSPAVPLETLRSADDRILLAGYTFTSDPVAAELAAAVRRGVEVSVLVEGGPVGGLPAGTIEALDDLAAAGATVRVVGGRGDRYAYHHAKYAVADDRALVTTENWKAAGVGGESSRGWGTVLEEPALADDLAAVFRADFEARDARAWTDYRTTATVVEDGSTGDEFPTRTGAATVDVDRAELLVAPDNAEGRLRELLAGADEEILVQQVRIGDRSNPLLRAAIDAARRGVAVRILLDSSWYVEAENRALVERLDRLAAAEDLPLEARLVEPGSAFEKTHTKGVVIDRETVVVGSANWNAAAFRENREVLLALHGADAAGFYATVFEADWGDDRRRLPAGLVVALLAAFAAAAVVGGRAIRFRR